MLWRTTRLPKDSGQFVHGQPGGTPDLYIPEIFKVPHKKMLMWPWEEARDKRDFRDLATNIFGFVPFGFVFVAYLTWNRKVRQAAMITILCGAAISLTIEILQEYIPGRDSGILDIITNTSGTHFRGITISLGSDAKFDAEIA